jgi:hypothetical protein
MPTPATLNGLNFLRSELDTGLTLAKIARSAKRADKRNRNLHNARKAYETVLRFLPGIILTTSQAREMKSKLEQLKKELRRIGEDVR